MLTPPETDHGTVPNMKFSFAMAHTRIEEGGWTREITQRELPIATTLAGVDMKLNPGAYRELHWHKEAKWGYVLEGSCRIGAVDQEKYIFQGQVPPALDSDRIVSPTGDVPHTFKHRMLAQQPERFSGGSVRVADSTNFKAATTIATALVEVEPGGLRELHWHPTDDEWQYYISGFGRMGVFASSGLARTFDFRAGDVGYVPFAYGHYIENLGNEPLIFLEMFRNPRFEDISATQWMANLPPQVSADTLNMPRSMIEALPRDKRPVVA